ncbi:MAG: ABC transporter permease [Rhodopirellula sp.]|nr:ABC transporter permease [Rhodopirellula sp.]
MLRLFPYVLKSLWRNRTRTLLTVSGSAVALFVFSVLGAVWDSYDRIGGGEQNERTLVVFQANRFCPATSHLPEDYAPTIEKLPGVAAAIPIQVFTNNCRASLDVVVFHGLPIEQLRQQRRLDLILGDWSRFDKSHDAALAGRTVANRRGLKIGEKWTIGDVSVTIAGIFAAQSAAEENLIYTRLDFLQRTPGLNAVGSVTQLEVVLEEAADADAVCRAIDERFRGGPVPTDTRPQGAFQASTLADLAEMLRMVRYLGYACVGLVLALVAATTVMTVQDRIGEHALLQTLGFSPPRIFGLVLAESTLMSTVGGLLGVCLTAALLGPTGLALSAEAVTVAIRPSLNVALTGLAVAVAVGILAGILPAWRAAVAEIVGSLQEI